jgi:MFS transporter, DHA2 family, multidrug resistance protein
MTSPDANMHDTYSVVTAHPLLGIAGVPLGALIAKCTGRLINVGLADIRGGLTWPADVLTFADFYQVIRLLRGKVGNTLMGHFIREEFHSNSFGLNVQFGNRFTNSRLLGLQHEFVPHSTGPTAIGRAAGVLGLQVREQACTLAISDSFLLLATCCVASLVVVSFMSKVPTQYRQVAATPVGTK